MEIDLIQVKGKTQPEAVFAVLGRAEVEQDPRCRELRELNAQMLASFRKQQWDEALDLIARCRKIADGFDVAGLYDMYEERIATYRAEPPGPDWDGVYEAEVEIAHLRSRPRPAPPSAAPPQSPAARIRARRRRRARTAESVCGIATSSTSVSQRLSSMIQSPPSRTATMAWSSLAAVLRTITSLTSSCGDARRGQRDVFGDGVILAVAAAGGEGLERRAPAVGHAPLRHVAHRLDRQIDGAVDDADAGEAGQRAALRNDGKKSLAPPAGSAVRSARTARKLHCRREFSTSTPCHLVKTWPNADGGGGEAEWLRHAAVTTGSSVAPDRVWPSAQIHRRAGYCPRALRLCRRIYRRDWLRRRRWRLAVARARSAGCNAGGKRAPARFSFALGSSARRHVGARSVLQSRAWSLPADFSAGDCSAVVGDLLLHRRSSAGSIAGTISLRVPPLTARSRTCRYRCRRRPAIPGCMRQMRHAAPRRNILTSLNSRVRRFCALSRLCCSGTP